MALARMNHSRFLENPAKCSKEITVYSVTQIYEEEE